MADEEDPGVSVEQIGLNEKPEYYGQHVEYTSLVCIEEKGGKVKGEESKSRLMTYVGNPQASMMKYSELAHVERSGGIIANQSQRGMHHMFCITMYNEPYIQILQSLAGIYRAYFELLEINKNKYKDKISVCIICDGYPIFTKGQEGMDNWERYEKAGMYDNDISNNYWKINQEREGNKKHDNFEYSKVPSLSKLENNSESIADITLETKNIAHCYSKSMKFENFLDGLSVQEQQGFKIDNLAILDFLYGDDEETNIKTRRFFSMPIDVHLVVKHFNRGKIESHLWFFKGFCNTVQPTLATIIDAGTIPLWNSLSRMSIFMELNYNTGACCGEIEVMLNEKHDDGREVTFFESILLRSQYVEYKLSHYLDKSAESLFGYISVLPGAYSMFRWQCIEGVPLNEFLKGTVISDPSRPYPSCPEGNKFLAEDRIMPLEIISKEDKPFIIRYVPGCKAYTDAPSDLKVLIKQRRRWFNGSLFATLYVLCHPLRICRRRGKLRALFYWLFFLYMAINTLAGLLIVGLYYAAYSIFLRSVFSDAKCPDFTKTANILENVYLIFVFLTLILSTCVRLEWCDQFFKAVAVFMGIFSVLMSIAVFISVINLELNYKVYIAVGGVICTYILPMIFNFRRLKFLNFMKGTFYIFFMTPTYINIMTIYAISNIHDVTWGSRGSGDGSKIESKRDKAQRIDYENFRCNWLVVWLLANITTGWCVVFFSREDQTEYLFLVILALGGIVALKIIFSVCYEIRFWCKNVKMRKRIRLDMKEHGMRFNPDIDGNRDTQEIEPTNGPRPNEGQKKYTEKSFKGKPVPGYSQRRHSISQSNQDESPDKEAARRELSNAREVIRSLIEEREGNIYEEYKEFDFDNGYHEHRDSLASKMNSSKNSAKGMSKVSESFHDDSMLIVPVYRKKDSGLEERKIDPNERTYEDQTSNASEVTETNQRPSSDSNSSEFSESVSYIEDLSRQDIGIRDSGDESKEDSNPRGTVRKYKKKRRR
ncbi:unnamed protein product [Moneuplotes crassus]|uniref:chitin synthase n=1 Tax=Euplotes crassus TaxID=5936 RepID=A0AAD1UIY1_EUPCR|nr:unnamed protein product [Moneuplotes crassus]